MDRRLVRHLLAATAVLALATPAPAQEGQKLPEMTTERKAEMEAYVRAGTPGPAHRVLAALVGDYDLKIRSWQEPGGPAIENTGTATRSLMLGGRVLVEDVKSAMMGFPYVGRAMMGFDNVSGKYWSTWNDSMSTGIMVSEGTCDPQTKACAFTGSRNDPVRKAPVTARMTTRWTSAGTAIFELFGPGRDGQEMRMMEITYTKK